MASLLKQVKLNKSLTYFSIFYSGFLQRGWEKSLHVEKPLNGHPRENGLWSLKKGWSLNGGRNNRKAIIGTLIAGRLIGVAV